MAASMSQSPEMHARVAMPPSAESRRSRFYLWTALAMAATAFLASDLEMPSASALPLPPGGAKMFDMTASAAMSIARTRRR